MERPLPDDVARPARAYLAALVPADEVSDAWHELLGDVAYWGDRELLPVLRLAHQVVLQHERITPEVAALALVESGINRPADVAIVLDTDVEEARRWTRAALDTRDGDTRDGQDDPGSELTPPAADDTPWRRGEAAAEPTVPAPAPPREALRIGFDADDGPLPDPDGRGVDRRLPVRTIVLAAVALWSLVAVLWMLAR